MPLNSSNITISREQLQTLFPTYTFVQMLLYISQKTSKRLFDWQILKVFLVPYFTIAFSSFIQLHTYKSLELSSLPLYSNFMLNKFYITTVNGITLHTLLMLSLYLPIYIYSFSKPNQTSLVIMRSYSLDYGHP